MATFTYQRAKCCGVIELADVSALPTPKAVIDTFVTNYFNADGQSRAFVYWTGVVGGRKRVFDEMFHANRSDDYGTALQQYITDEQLGPVTVIPPAVNYSGNALQVWFWVPDWSKLRTRFNTLHRQVA